MVKSLVALITALIRDAADLYASDPTRDIETVTRRHGSEGEPFLTITLDAYRVAFEAALDAGTWDNIHIPGFRKDGQLPAFLRGFVSRVFQRNGKLRQDPDVQAVAIIRQICGFAAKMRTDCDPRYVDAALTSFQEIDAKATHGASPALKAVFASLFDGVLRDVSDDISLYRLRVKHGDGASQEKLLPNSRWRFAHWEERLEPFFPSYVYARLNANHALSEPDVRYAAEDTPVRVSLVPKTAKGPRTIAIEPSWRMYCQQGLMDSLVRSIEARGLPPRFSTSEDNRSAARIGSVDRSIATIDLSAASDSVSSRLVWELLSGRPLVRDALFACRSGRAELPDGTTLTLNKFASMGSAVCFPIEAMVFSAIAVYAIVPKLPGGFPDLRFVRKVAGQIIVFGDDIIVPNDMYKPVVDALSLFGFKVNEKKSFSNGFFRESCGADYFMGHDVSYVKVRRPLSFTTTAANDTISTVSLRNQLAEKGLWPQTVRELDKHLVRGLRVFPYGPASSPGLVRTHTSDGVEAAPDIHRLNRRLWRPEQKAFVPRSKFKEDRLDDIHGLHKSLRMAERLAQPSENPVSYEFAGRAVRVDLTARWLPVA
jgi:hypothetical protein